MTLLEKAKQVSVGRRGLRKNLREEAEIVIAWLRDQISTKQAASAMELKPASAHSRFPEILRRAVNSGIVIITLSPAPAPDIPPSTTENNSHAR